MNRFFKISALLSAILLAGCASNKNENILDADSAKIEFNTDYCSEEKTCLTTEKVVHENYTFYSFLNILPIKRSYIKLFLKSDTNNSFADLQVNDVLKAYYSKDKKLFTIVVKRDGKEIKVAKYKIDDSSKKEPVVQAYYKIEDKIEKQANELKQANVESFYKELTKNKTLEVNSGAINGNIKEVLLKNNIPEGIVFKLNNIFKDTFNMNSLLSNGRYNVLFDKKMNIFYASFNVNGNEYNIYKFGNKYFDENGESIDKIIGRVPNDYREMSSPYSLNRRHPITGKIGAHNGIDYAGARNSEIKTTGDGVVKFVGQMRGYGNLVIIEHLNNLETRYGHMQRFSNIKEGQQVRKGDVIGYVGTTGYATGPHVHFEIRKNDEPQDPATTRLTPKTKLSPKDKITLSKVINSYTLIEKNKLVVNKEYK